MSASRFERAKRLKILAQTYRKTGLFEPWICTYCGVDAETYDHVPPVSWAYSLGPDHFRKCGIPLITVPACAQCNRFLGNKKLFTVQERAQRIARKFAVDLDGIRAAKWTEDELSELGRNLRHMVEAGAILYEGTQRRMRWARQVVSMTVDPALVEA